jgi:hypothetical protein
LSAVDLLRYRLWLLLDSGVVDVLGTSNTIFGRPLFLEALLFQWA